MNSSDILTIAPHIALVGVALLALVGDLLISNKKHLSYGLTGLLIVPAVLSIGIWLSWFDIGNSAFGGAIAGDGYAVFFQLLIMGILAMVMISSTRYFERVRGYEGELLALLLLTAVGMTLLVSAREFITVYISFELAALPFVGLAILRRDKSSTEAGVKFLVLSAIGSAFLLMGIVLIYGYSGTTYFSEIADRFLRAQEVSSSGAFGLGVGVIMVTAGFGFKMAIAPWHMWVPDVYQGAPTPIAAYLSTASKVAAFAVLLRLTYEGIGNVSTILDYPTLLGALAIASMIYGNLGALVQSDIKRLLGYSTIAHAGYILIGVAAVAAHFANSTISSANIGVQSVMIYLVGYAVTNLAVFFGVMSIATKVSSNRIKDFAQTGRRYPIMASIVAIGMLSLVGIPPTVGFLAKLSVFGASIDAGLEWLTVVGIINSFVSAYYYLRVVAVMFFDKAASEHSLIPWRLDKTLLAVTTLAIVGVLILGILPFLLISLTETALFS